ncbi:hypothetical protein N9L85_02855 [Euryarchaeota archaeon]|nr:hypothetical protein [Euryarchaeota archaeon]MDA8805504.1 hypothetical protein [Euryarchaeota archaeon]MDA9829107.1 hypothetical protein [Candidatus Poseidoniaceae archaeon]
MATIEQLDEGSWESFLNAPLAVLMLSKKECISCIQLGDELSTWLSSGTAPPNVRFGKIMLDDPGMARFKLAQPWISHIDIMPFMAIFVHGERVSEWGGGTLSRFQNKLAEHV